MSKNGSSHNLQTQPVPQKQAQITPRVKQSPSSSKPGVAPSSSKAALQAVKRYSMQNSPRGGAKNYNVSQQYQMFQQVLATKQKQLNKSQDPSTVSPR